MARKKAPKDKLPGVYIGIATYGQIASGWWASITPMLLLEHNVDYRVAGFMAISTALPDSGKNKAVNAEVDPSRWGGIASPNAKGRNERTDANKSKIVGGQAGGGVDRAGFLASEADWLLLIDDDTIPPHGGIKQLLSLGREVVGGVVFHGKKPYLPTAYERLDSGLYRSITDFVFAEIRQIDSIGMGLTMIHRSVFEKIMDEFVVYQRPNASIFPMHKSKVVGSVYGKSKNGKQPDTVVEDGIFKQPVKPVEPHDNRPFPFFSMEYGRTEDHYFAELCDQVGIKPWVDTSVIAEHLKLQGITRVEHREQIERLKRAGHISR